MSSVVHVWGESHRENRVWSNVAGILTSATSLRCLFVLQAFIDDSVTPGGTFVLAGAISSADRWARFAVDWERMLRHGLLAKDGSRYFKMSEMALIPERRERVPWFYAVLAEHSICFLSYSFNLADLKSAQERILVPGHELNWSTRGSPYIIAIRAMLDMFHLGHQKIMDRLGLPQNSKVDFIFDDRAEKRAVNHLWDEYLQLWSPAIRARFGGVPRFENDQKLLPLQGADLWAWWVREWEENGRSKEFPMPKLPEGVAHPIWVGMEHSQDQLVSIMAASVANRLGDVRIIDTKSGQDLAS